MGPGLAPWQAGRLEHRHVHHRHRRPPAPHADAPALRVPGATHRVQLPRTRGAVGAQGRRARVEAGQVHHRSDKLPLAKGPLRRRQRQRRWQESAARHDKRALAPRDAHHRGPREAGDGGRLEQQHRAATRARKSLRQARRGRLPCAEPHEADPGPRPLRESDRALEASGRGASRRKARGEAAARGIRGAEEIGSESSTGFEAD